MARREVVHLDKPRRQLHVSDLRLHSTYTTKIAISKDLEKLTEKLPADPDKVVVVMVLLSPPKVDRLLTLVELGAVKAMRVAVVLEEPLTLTWTAFEDPVFPL
jgi:hypothetical protein